MNNLDDNEEDGATLQAIMAALHTCYGSLKEPNFRKVSELIDSDPYRPLIETLQSSGVEVTDTTDLNNDVSACLVLKRAGDQGSLALSGVGPYAALLWWAKDERYVWVTQPENAPNPLAALVAQAVQGAGFELLDRDLVSRTVKMNWYDGSEKVTLYQALFTDSDVIP